MPTLTGSVADVTGVALAPGQIRQVFVKAPGERPSLADGGVLIVSAPVQLGSSGSLSVTLEPGPAVLTVDTYAGGPDVYDLYVTSDMTLLSEAVDEAAPAQDRLWAESVMVQLRDEAVAAAARAEQAAEDVDAAIAGAADQVVQAVEGDRVAAESAATSAAEDRVQTGLDRTATAADRVATGLDRVATGQDRTATGEDRTQTGLDREQTRLDRVATGQDRTQTGLDRSAAAGSATAAAGFADDAEQWAKSFGLTATSTTGAPGTSASVTVTGSGPEYGLALTVPRGDKGAKGDDGEVSQAALDAAVASLVDNAPEALNTLSELATSLGNDPNFATTVSTEIGLRAKTADMSTALAGKADVGAETTATWAGVSGKPATFPPTIGTTASTAKAGNYVPAWSEVSGKPTTFTPATHSHTKAEVGLANVDNTSDAAKPVSTAQQAAINAKVTNAGGASGLWVGTTASLPTTGTTGVLYVTY